MAKIKNILGREILDSRGNPTVTVELTLTNSSIGIASVPSGASTGKHEAIELRDDDKSRYDGKGVLGAIANVSGEIAKQLIDRDYDQASLDTELIALDGTPNKSHLGANAILGVSLAFAHAFAKSQGKELFETIARTELRSAEVGSPTSSEPEVVLHTQRFPTPMFNILNGGKHAHDSTDIQ
ncbi:MAG: phosphopyruvate hydratase, partial [Candidatus Vogelbacteria bacterium]|nr:phosphopyruvate hydratase [Candidatus Vogelbacteria bacterium]